MLALLRCVSLTSATLAKKEFKAMKASDFREQFSTSLSNAICIVSEREGRWVRVATPFVFDDGDHPRFVFKDEGDGWKLSDEGFTLFNHCAHEGDAEWERFVADTLSMWGIENRDGELTLDMEGSEDYVDALIDFGQAVTAIAAAARFLRILRTIRD